MLYDDFLTQAQQNPDQIAVIDENGATTYGQLLSRINHLAELFQNLPVDSGLEAEAECPVISITGERNAEAIAAMYAAMMVGCAYHFMDYNLTMQRIRTILDKTKPRIVVNAGYSFTIQYLEEERWRFHEHLDGKDDPYESAPFFLDLAGDYPCPIAPERRVKLPEEVTFDATRDCKRNPHAIACIFPSSGTTGEPKLVCTAHDTAKRTLIAYAKYAGLTESYINLACRQFFGNDYARMDIDPTLANGNKLVIMPEYIFMDPAKLRTFFEDNNIHVWPDAAYVLSLTLKNDTEHIRAFEPLDTVITSGEKLSQSFLDAFFQRYPDTKIVNYLGATDFEFLFVQTLTANNYKQEANRFQPVPEIEALIKDPDDGRFYRINSNEKLPPQGELYVPASWAADRILNQHVPLEDVPAHGSYLPTGDIYHTYRDNAGIMFEYAGRIDDMFKASGFTLNPLEAEDALRHRCETVKDAALIYTKKDAEFTLVIQPNGSHDRQEIEREIQPILEDTTNMDLMALTKCTVVIWDGELPKTQSHKPDRRKIGKHLENQQNNPPIGIVLSSIPKASFY